MGSRSCAVRRIARPAAMLSGMTVQADMTDCAIDYPVGERLHRGYLVHDPAVDRPRPLLLMVPNWLGTTPANRQQAARIAGRDYVVLVADLFGQNRQPADADAARREVQALYADRAELRRRVTAAHATAAAWAAQSNGIADAHRLAAVGFCFGGAAVLELARTGAHLDAVVSIHGHLSLPPGNVQNQPFRTRILALHGDADPFVPQPQVDAFLNEMRTAGADWQLVRFGGAVHSFTDPDAHTPSTAQYHETAARRAFTMMRNFLDEAFSDHPQDRTIPSG